MQHGVQRQLRAPQVWVTENERKTLITHFLILKNSIKKNKLCKTDVCNRTTTLDHPRQLLQCLLLILLICIYSSSFCDGIKSCFKIYDNLF